MKMASKFEGTPIMPVPEEEGALNVLSLGAGMQSSTLALMAAHGLIKPMPDFAVFADTQDEPKAVYEWLEWLKERLPFPVHVVTKGKLSKHASSVVLSKNGNYRYKTSIPAFFETKEGNTGLMARYCTKDFKIDPLYSFIKKQRRKGQTVIIWIGISWDEASRMRDAREDGFINRYPLIERAITRGGCREWMDEMNYPTPPRSACTFCPYHTNREWKKLKENSPEEFAGVVEFERALQREVRKIPGYEDGAWYLHRSMKPIDQVDFDNGDGSQLDLGFGSECEGMCGV